MKQFRIHYKMAGTSGKTWQVLVTANSAEVAIAEYLSRNPTAIILAIFKI